MIQSNDIFFTHYFQERTYPGINIIKCVIILCYRSWREITIFACVKKRFPVLNKSQDFKAYMQSHILFAN